MKSRALLGGLMLSVLAGGIATSAETRSTRVTTVARTTQAQPQRVVAFKTERTDSWLCSNVSVFFCTDVMPKLTTTPDAGMAVAGRIPDRSRKN